jgi:TonB family protein
MSGWNEAACFSFLCGVAFKGTAVFAAAGLVAAWLRKQSAAARHLVWTAAFAAILLLPFLSAALPAWRIRLAGAAMPSATVVFQDTAAASADGAGAHSASAGSVRIAAHAAPRRPDWKLWLMLLWAAGAAMAGVRLTVGYAAAWRIQRSARPFQDGSLAGMLAQTLGVREPVELLEAGPRSMPMTFGLTRATILLPADAAGWGEERRRSVLLHELAHVRRRDAATHLLARVAMAVDWWNPLAWVAWREFLKERERATDDLVLHAGARASDYASHLLDAARGLQTPGAIGWAAAAMARPSQLEARLRAILDSGVDRTAPGRATVWATALLAAATIVPLAAMRAQDNSTQAVPADIDAAISVAKSQENYQTLESAAQAAVQSKKYDAAEKLLEAAVAIRAETAGEQSAEYGAGLVKLADVKRKSDPEAARELYGKAVQLLGGHSEAALALTRLGQDALTKKLYAQAFDYFQGAKLADPAHAGSALMWMAVGRQHEKNMEEAETLYQSAMAAADPRSNEAAVILRVYAEFLRVQAKSDQAAEFQERATAIEKGNAKPAPTLAAGVFHVGKGVTVPVPILRPEPEYTEEARLARLWGTVVLRVVIGTDGVPHDSHVIRGVGLGLDENAIEAVGQWQFKPATKDGQPVPVAATIEVNFRLL